MVFRLLRLFDAAVLALGDGVGDLSRRLPVVDAALLWIFTARICFESSFCPASASLATPRAGHELAVKSPATPPRFAVSGLKRSPIWPHRFGLHHSQKPCP